MDVDDRVRPPRDELGAEDLHVAGEHHQRHAVLVEHLPAPRAPAPAWCRRVTGRCTKSTPNQLGDLGVVGVVGDHHRDVDRQLAAPRAAPAGRRGSALRATRARRRAGRRRRSAPRTPCSKRSTSGRERRLDLVAREVAAVERELDPLEEHAVGAVGVLLRVDDVAAVAEHEVGDGRDDAGLVGTRQQQHRGGAVDRAQPDRLHDEAGDPARDPGRRDARERGRRSG